MKKILILVFVLLLITPFVLARQTQYSQDNNLRIDLVTISPSPVSLGSTSELTFEATNTGSFTLENLEFSSSAVFPLLPVDTTPVIISSLSQDESKQFKFKVKAATSASEGSYKFTIQFKEPTQEQITVAAFTIPVKRVQRTIASTKVTTTPESIRPGSTAWINVEIENNADFAMRDVVVRLNFTDAVPLAPYRTTSEKQIKLIPADSSETVSFQVIALPDGEPNVYRLPMQMTFDDELGNENKKQDYIGIIIASKPDYDLNLEDSTLIEGKKDKITISLSNIGPANIRYLIMEVMPSKEYKILSTPRTYLGNLEPDDYETAEFDFYPSKSGDIKIKVKLEYKDDLNNPIAEEKEIKAYVYSTLYARWLGLIPGKFTMNTIIFVLGVIFIFLTYKAWRISRDVTNAMKSALLKMLTFAVNVIRHLRWHYLKRIPRKIRLFLITLR